MRARRLVVAAVSFATLVTGASLAVAHWNGHESRTVAQCQRLPSPERGHCTACVTRPNPHHYHPNYPPGNRCRPNNGRP